MTEAPVQVQSPVFTVDGALVRTLGRDCVCLEIHEGLAGLRTLEAQFLAVGAGDDGPPGRMRHLDGSTVDFGKSVTVAIGPDGGQRFAFEGTISALELVIADGEPQIVVMLAEDALMRLRMTRRLRSWARVTDAELASGIAREHGLDADVQADGPRYDVVQQLNQSDLAFLRDRARLVQAEIWVEDGTLNFKTRPNRAGTEVTLAEGPDLIDTQLRADLAHQRSKVRVSGYDAVRQAVIDQQAGAEAIAAEIDGGRTGPATLRAAFGERGGVGESLRVREAPLTAREATDWAKAEMLRRSRRFVTVVATTAGTPELMVGSRVTLEDVGAPFEGPGYDVTRVCHTYDLDGGHHTYFEAERPTLNEAGS
jgi:uncharacterized protein